MNDEGGLCSAKSVVILAKSPRRPRGMYVGIRRKGGKREEKLKIAADCGTGRKKGRRWKGLGQRMTREGRHERYFFCFCELKSFG